MWKLIVLALLAIAFGASILMFHFVEEPARRWMRRMADAGRVQAGGGLTAVHTEPDEEPELRRRAM
jgi:peptidoglycan/LPS O-acetylase OafA/YrhL